MDLGKMIGYKFFKENEDKEIECIRILKYWNFGDTDSIKVINTKTNEDKIIDIRELKTYTALKPDAMLMFSSVIIDGAEDVIVAAYLLDRLENRDMRPFCVCRQGITDVYYNLLIKDESDMLAGLSMNILNIPQGFDYSVMLASDEVKFSNAYMIYKDDTVSTIFDTFSESLKDYDDTMKKIYDKYCASNPAAIFRDEDKGWCKTLKLLLQNNNFQSDLDEMMGITTVEFEIDKYLEEAKVSEDSKESYLTVTDELKYWLSYLYKININKVFVLPYDNDIEFESLSKSRYFIFRDISNKLFVFVYTIGSAYKEAELEELDKKLDFSTKFRINYLDKYKNLTEVNINC